MFKTISFKFVFVTKSIAYTDDPIDPKLIDHECPINTAAAAVSGENPRLIKIGTTTITGTPKPAMPCKNEANIQLRNSS